MPFNFSQPRSKGTVPQNQRVLRTLTPRGGSDENTLNSRYSKRNHMNGKNPSKEFGVDFASQLSIAQKLATRKPESSIIQARNGDLTERMETLKGTGPSKSHAIKPMAVAQATSSQVSIQPDAKTMNQNIFAASVQTSASQASTEACLNNLDLLSIKDPSKKRTLQAAVAASSSSDSNGMYGQSCPQILFLWEQLLKNLYFYNLGKEEAFNLDHEALLSILRNEGVGAKRVGSATPESTKPCNYQVRLIWTRLLLFTLSMIDRDQATIYFLVWIIFCDWKAIVNTRSLFGCYLFFQRISVMNSHTKAGAITGWQKNIILCCHPSPLLQISTTLKLCDMWLSHLNTK